MHLLNATKERLYETKWQVFVMVIALFNFLGFVSKNIYICIYLADFLKTNLTKFAVIWVKRRQKAGFWGLISSKITLKERRKKKSEEEERRRRNKKSNGCTLSFLMATLKIVFGRKKSDNCWTQKVHLVVTFSNIRLDTSSETQGREKRRDASFQVWAKEPLG